MKELSRCNRLDSYNQSIWFLCIIPVFLLVYVGSGYASEQGKLAIPFDGQYGQLEIGGKYVGAGFHNSFPFPGRISFYYPVANSVDLSSDYWYRGYESHPYSVLLSIDGITESFGSIPWKYEWTPFRAFFIKEESKYRATIEYRFAEDLPVMVVMMKITNRTFETKEFRVFTGLSLSIRTSHSFTLKDRSVLLSSDNSSLVIGYPDQDTDSTAVFVLSAGDTQARWSSAGIQNTDGNRAILIQPRAIFDYIQLLAPGEEMEIIHIIGSSRMDEWEDIIMSTLEGWEESVDAYEQRVTSYALDPVFIIDQKEHLHTLRWSRALLKTNLHYIDGTYVPMPCPAEYNFYFTHDMLLTNLGSVIFDINRVRKDLLFLYSLTGDDNILPHAYYWKDDKYVTEFAGTDNWNHLWFIVSLNSYLIHSGDEELVSLLYPVADKSLQMILENYHDGLMYASRPDWWDIGNIYGARSYLTILSIRAIDSYASLTIRLGRKEAKVISYLEKSTRMRKELVDKLWDDDAGYLLNMLDESSIDRHYYAGSLLAAAFEILDRDKIMVLLDTARRELLDVNLGIRNAMPADFHELIDLYRFQGMEAGEPYQYINGGVWSHGNAWYALGLIAAGLPDEAEEVVRNYMTVDGILNSPRGQPSFFEYRTANRESVRYGEIDKPSFLWAGGWYLHMLYRLAGLRENGWNVSFDSTIPAIFNSVDYIVWNMGKQTKVSISGRGKYFKRIEFDGDISHSAIVHRDVQSIVLELGTPDVPYLASANCVIKDVSFDYINSFLSVNGRGVRGQVSRLSVISSTPCVQVEIDGGVIVEERIVEDEGVYRIDITARLDKTDSKVTFIFR